MSQQRWATQRLEVRLVLEDEVPVGHVAKAGDGVAAQRGDLLRQEDDRVEERAADECEEGGQKPASAPAPEGDQVDAAVAAAALGQQQRGDEVAADDEEDVDADESAAEQADLSVVEENGSDGECAQAIDRRNVGQESRSSAGDRIVRPYFGGGVGAAGRTAGLTAERMTHGEADSKQEPENATGTDPAVQGETSE